MKRIIFAVPAAILLLGLALPATAASAAPTPVVGNYAIADQGQGSHAGGPMYADHTLGGGGAISGFLDGQQIILVITSGTWSGDAASGVSLCITVKGIKDPLHEAPGPLCLPPLPVNTGPVRFSSGMLVNISLR
jgi:hypothetical protein